MRYLCTLSALHTTVNVRTTSPSDGCDELLMYPLDVMVSRCQVPSLTRRRGPVVPWSARNGAPRVAYRLLCVYRNAPLPHNMHRPVYLEYIALSLLANTSETRGYPSLKVIGLGSFFF